MSEDLVLLHGFGGTNRAWEGVIAALPPERYRPLALDLPGHGVYADSPRPITFAGCVDHVLTLAPERFVLCGYSMGGRIALHVALAAPERVTRLLLIGVNPGIEEPAERGARRQADDLLATRLEREPYEQFIESWRTQSLFADDPPEVGILARADQRRNDPIALAAVMRGLGAGVMEPLWSRLDELRMPAAVVVGDRDDKFLKLGLRMVDLMPRAELIVVPGGHGLPLENPGAVARVAMESDGERG